MESITLRASHRIELAGDWTDLPEYCEDHKGRVINMAVDIPTLGIEVAALQVPGNAIEFVSTDQGMSTRIDSVHGLRPGSPTEDSFFLAKAVVCDVLDVDSARLDESKDVCCGPFRGGWRITTTTRGPRGTGLGTSSILAAAIRVAWSEVAGHPVDSASACRSTYEMERSLKLRSGWQDSFGGMIRGIKDLKWNSTAGVSVVRLGVPSQLPRTLERLAIVAFVGSGRFSANVLAEVGESIRSRDHRTLHSLTALRALCDPMRKAVTQGRYEHLGALIRKTTSIQRKLHPGIVSAEVLTMLSDGSQYCYGERICGAGESGALLFLCRDRHAHSRLRERLHSYGVQPLSLREGQGLCRVPESHNGGQHDG